jgi:hypothetical protein
MSEEDTTEIVRLYKRVSQFQYRDAGILPIPATDEPGPGQFSKDGLSYYMSFENSQLDISIWRFTRSAVTDKFAAMEELLLKANVTHRNFQPSVNADGSVFVFATSQTDHWEEDDIVLVNDEVRALAAQEIFARVEKNNDNTLGVKSKIVNAEVRTFPNPFQHEVTIEMKQTPGPNTVFIIYEMSGRVLKRQQLVNLRSTIQLSQFPAGTYIYQVLEKQKTVLISGKLVKG